MNFQQIRYLTIKKEGLLFFFDSSIDYPAARCLILNGLFPGFVLACQAIEKILKAAIFFESGFVNLRGWNNSEKHNPFLLKEELKKYRNYKLDKYNDFLKHLFSLYQKRYSNNPIVSKKGGSSDDLILFDEVYLKIAIKIPITKTAKKRTKLFVDLFDKNVNKYWNDGFWIRKRNRTLIEKGFEAK